MSKNVSWHATENMRHEILLIIQYRRQALERQDLNWSVIDSRLYNEAFTGRARPIARCTYCLQDDHAAN
jgi:hypothetical protein